MDREQFTFYASFAKSIQRIKKPADRALAYDTIVNYALFEAEPDLDNLPDTVCSIFDLVKPNLDASRRKAQGGKAGRKREDIDKISERCEEDTANKKKKENKKENKKEKEGEIENKCSPPMSPSRGNEKLARFSPPTVEDVKEYCLERCNNVDAQHFVDHYTSNGWKVGKNPMKDWKATVRTWERNGYEKGKQGHSDPVASRLKSQYEMMARWAEEDE